MDWLMLLVIGGVVTALTRRLWSQHQVLGVVRTFQILIAITVYSLVGFGLLLPQGGLQNILVVGGTLFGTMLITDQVLWMLIGRRVFGHLALRIGLYSVISLICGFMLVSPYPWWGHRATPDRAAWLPGYTAITLLSIGTILTLYGIALVHLARSIAPRDDLALSARVLVLRGTFTAAFSSQLVYATSLLVVLWGLTTWRWPLITTFELLITVAVSLGIVAVLPARWFRLLVWPLFQVLLARQRRRQQAQELVHAALTRVVPLATRVTFQTPQLQALRWEVEIADARRLLWSQHPRPLRPQIEAAVIVQYLTTHQQLTTIGRYAHPAPPDQRRYDQAVARALERHRLHDSVPPRPSDTTDTRAEEQC